LAVAKVLDLLDGDGDVEQFLAINLRQRVA
jgi:hypothetical protein